MPNATESTPVTNTSLTAQIEGLLDSDGSYVGADDATDDTESSAPIADDDGGEPAENPEGDSGHSQDPDDPQDDQTGSVIAPPQSWTSEEQETFQSLPPEVQQTIVRREKDQERTFQRKMQQVADERKVIEANSQRAANAEAQYAQTISQLLNLTVPELQQFDNVDWVRLSQEDPAQYVALTAKRDGLRQRVAAMQNETQRVQVNQHQIALQAYQARLAEQHELLSQAVPDFAEPAKAKALVGEITEAMRPFGFTDQELGTVYDSRIVRVMADYTRLKKAEAARQTAQGKKAATPAPRVMAPNATAPRGKNQKQKVDDQWKALARTRSGRDAARLIENIL